MSKLLLSMAAMALAMGAALAGGYDSMGFESPAFGLGPLVGQDGWGGGGAGGGYAPLVVTTPDPVLGLQAVRLEVPDIQGATSGMDMVLPGGPIGHTNTIVTVSFDIYRNQQVQNLWWWWWDSGSPTYGLQWDMSQATHPFGWSAAEAPTVFGRYANLTMEWNFQTGVATGWYDGAPVASIAIDGIDKLSAWTIVLSHDAADGSGGEGVWIDNFKVTVVPEPAALSVFGLGLAGLLYRLRRR